MALSAVAEAATGEGMGGSVRRSCGSLRGGMAGWPPYSRYHCRSAAPGEVEGCALCVPEEDAGTALWLEGARLGSCAAADPRRLVLRKSPSIAGNNKMNKDIQERQGATVSRWHRSDRSYQNAKRETRHKKAEG